MNEHIENYINENFDNPSEYAEALDNLLGLNVFLKENHIELVCFLSTIKHQSTYASASSFHDFIKISDCTLHLGSCNQS